MLSRTFLFVLTSLLIFSEGAVAARTVRKAVPKVTVNYSGSGFASFNETYTRTGSGGCSTETITAHEDASSVVWNTTWKNITPSQNGNPEAKTFSFSASNSRSDSQDCGGNPSSCTSTIGLMSGVEPGMLIAKSGKGFILTLVSEEQTASSNNTSSTCLLSSIFDNAITEGMNGKHVTALKVKITPNTKSKTTKLSYTIPTSFDCTDPAKQQAFLSTTCTIQTSFSGLVKVTGKWKAKLL